jgi:hypothetical protein
LKKKKRKKNFIRVKKGLVDLIYWVPTADMHFDMHRHSLLNLEEVEGKTI